MFPGSIFPRNEKHHFGIIFLVVLFLLELEETQGCAVVECICHRGEIDCLNLGYRSVPFFNSDGRVYDTLDLSKNRLRRVRGHAFKNLTVKKIKIRNNMRKLELHKKAFKGLEGILEVLIITRSQMETLPPFLFKKTKKLRVLILSDNHFVSLPPKVFKGASNVQTLDLMYNSLVKLVPGMFTGLDNLKFLRLGNNKISVIDTEAFRGLDYLNGLILSRNEIRDLQPRSFKRLVNLIRLDLGNNKIPALFPLMFRGMERLEELSLNANPLLIIGEAAFSSMSSLKTLYLSQGHLRYLKANMFKGLDKLDKLQLDNNYITYLQDNVFMYLPNLKRLQIINNVLSTINPCAFPDITKIKEIRATQNPLVCTCPLQWAVLESMPMVAGRCVAPSRNRGNQVAARMTYHGCNIMDIPTICKNGAGGRLATAVDPDHVVNNKTKMDKYLKAIMQVNETKRKEGSFTDRLKGVKKRRSRLG